ncbi:unnamed protein product, partial [Hymenolepis diminuta]
FTKQKVSEDRSSDVLHYLTVEHDKTSSRPSHLNVLGAFVHKYLRSCQSSFVASVHKPILSNCKLE